MQSIPSTETTTVVEYGIKKWAQDNPDICSLMGWWEDRQVAEEIVHMVSQGWVAVVVERTTTKTVTIKEA